MPKGGRQELFGQEQAPGVLPALGIPVPASLPSPVLARAPQPSVAPC